MRARERLYITKTGEVVGENDRREVRLYAKLGDEIPDDVAKKFGWIEPDSEPPLIMSPEVKRKSTKKKSGGGLTINRLKG